MRVERLGKIFDPADHLLPDGCTGYAQSPQVLPLDDGVRIYFSARARDKEGGKFRSHIAFADFDLHLRVLRRVSRHTVIPLGRLGCFDEHGIFPMNVIRRGDEVWGYTCGWNRRVSVSVDTAIGLAISRDGGETFRRQGDGPILGASLHEPFLIGDGFVIEVGRQLHMWYIFGTRWSRESAGAAPDRVYKIGHAVSEDGIHWIKEDGRQVIPDAIGSNECQALPSVVQFGGVYHMVFCYRDMHGFRTDPRRGYHIGYASSADLSTWTRADSPLDLLAAPGDWDFLMQCYPHLFVNGGQLILLYNGDNFGRDGFGAARIFP